MSAPLLEINNLSIAYRAVGGDVRAVRNVDLALNPGEIVGLAGESGCGKSTLAYGSVRLLRPPAVVTGGSVIYRGRRLGAGGLRATGTGQAPEDGIDVLSANPAALRQLRWREIAIVFQSAMNALNPVLRIRDQLLDALDAHLPLSRQEQLERVDSMLDLVGIPRDRANSYPHELSGGMRQRVMIAMALAVEPEVVIMDEPTTGLDVVVQREILHQIMALKDRLGFAVLFITHDLSLLLEVADRVMIMYAGQVMEAAPTADIRRGGAHPYTAGLLRSFPKLRGPRRRLAGIPGTPPDLRGELPGCPFHERCSFATDACLKIDVRLAPTDGAPEQLTACPFVIAEKFPPPSEAPGAKVWRAALDDPVAAKASNGSAPLPAGVGSRELVLEAIDLHKQFGSARRGGKVVNAVQGVSFELRRGVVVALVGESGSGKSTVAKLLAGQETRSGGAIELDGKEIDPSKQRHFRDYKQQVQMVFQDPFASLNPLHTVRYHLERALKVHGRRTGRDSGQAEVDRLLAQVRLTPVEKFRDAYPHELSGGQRQRVSFARALAADPRVLLADEPVSMLDVSIRLEILDLIEELRSKLDLAVLYITHDIASARYFADEILVMHRGEIVERGPAEAVVSNPKDEYTQLLIASSPDPDTFATETNVIQPALAVGQSRKEEVSGS